MIYCSSGLQAQFKVSLSEIKSFYKDTVLKSEEVNAIMFRPIGYEKILMPKLPDSLLLTSIHDPKKKEELVDKRNKFNPYLAFSGEIYFRKDDVIVGFNNSWIRLSAYFEYNQQDITEDEYLRESNEKLLDLKLIPSYYGHFELIQNIEEKDLKLINADAGNIYFTRAKFKFRDTVFNYESILVNLVKYDLGKAHLIYYFPIGQKEKALKAIQNTWGLVQFKKDEEFTHPDRSGWIPKQENPELYFGKFSHLNNPDQVKREREKYQIRLKRIKSRVKIQEGVKLASVEKISEAKLKFEEALTIDNTNSEPYVHLLILSMGKNQEDSSRTYLQKLEEINPKGTETNFLKAKFYKHFGKVDSARYYFKYIIEKLDTINYRAYQELALIERDEKNYSLAKQYFDNAVKIFEKERIKAKNNESHRVLNINELAVVRLNYSKMLIKNRETEEAIELLLASLNDDNESKNSSMYNIYGRITPFNIAEIHFLLGSAYLLLNDHSNAENSLKTAKKLGKVLPDVFENLLTEFENQTKR